MIHHGWTNNGQLSWAEYFYRLYILPKSGHVDVQCPIGHPIRVFIFFKKMNGGTECDWEEFQVRTVFPNTVPGSPHDGVNIACYFCGHEVLRGEEICRIKGGAIWSNCVPTTIRKGRKEIYNKFKKCVMFDAVCQNCEKSVGTIYPIPYLDHDDAQSFPCVKYTYMREGRNNEVMNSTALLVASIEDCGDIVQNLSKA